MTSVPQRQKLLGLIGKACADGAPATGLPSDRAAWAQRAALATLWCALGRSAPVRQAALRAPGQPAQKGRRASGEQCAVDYRHGAHAQRCARTRICGPAHPRRLVEKGNPPLSEALHCLRAVPTAIFSCGHI